MRHPDYPYGFLLGVECDGASYHSSRSARDRDRLRQEILEGKGWHLYRIWSTDWFTDALNEKKKLKAAIEARLTEAVKQMPPAKDISAEVEVTDSNGRELYQPEETETQRRLFT